MSKIDFFPRFLTFCNLEELETLKNWICNEIQRKLVEAQTVDVETIEENSNNFQAVEVERVNSDELNSERSQKRVTRGGKSQKIVEKRPFLCQFCCKGFFKKAPLEVHETTHNVHEKIHTKDVHEQKTCSVLTSKNVHENGRKLKNSTKIGSYKCQFCNQTFSRLCNKVNHEKSYHKEFFQQTENLPEKDPLSCQFCDRTFLKLCGKVKHEKSHTREFQVVSKNLHSCQFCDKKFTRQCNKMLHEKSFHEESFHQKNPEIVQEKKDPLSCQFCDKTFSRLCNKLMHEKSHAQKHFCKNCNKEYSNFTDLCRHMKNHKKGKPYKCGFCPKRFHQKGNKNVHERIHTREKISKT